MAKMNRMQILFDAKQQAALAEIARRMGTSISKIVHIAVQKWLDSRHEGKQITSV